METRTSWNSYINFKHYGFYSILNFINK
jgi:hypothetical protein